MMRWMRWHCPPDTGFEIGALAVWGRARYISVTEAPHNTEFHTWMGKKHFAPFKPPRPGTVLLVQDTPQAMPSAAVCGWMRSWFTPVIITGINLSEGRIIDFFEQSMSDRPVKCTSYITEAEFSRNQQAGCFSKGVNCSSFEVVQEH